MEDVILKSIDRSADQLDAFSIRVAETSKHLNEEYENLKQEITLLKAVNNDVKKTISETVEKNLPEIQKITDQSVRNHISREVMELSNPITSLTQELSGFSKTIESRLETYHQKFKFTGVALCVSFCIGCLLSGAGLWYFFPQHHTTKVEFSPKQRKAMEMGTLLKYAFPKLSKTEQINVRKAMGDSWNEYYKELLNR